MLRSMYAGISGMKNFQTKLDIIGNNIANVNTSGFKKGRITFQEMMSQTTAGAQGPTANRGGINASQVGIGSQQGTIDNIHTQGFRQVTNNPLDFSIQGDGMFAVVEMEAPRGDGTPTTPAVPESAEYYYTRAGNFYLDEDGYIVNSEGMYLVGFQGNAAEPVLMRITQEVQSFNVQQDGLIEIVQDGQRQDLARIALANFANPSGLIKEGNNLYKDSASSGTHQLVQADSEDSSSQIVSNSLEMSNVDLAEEFTEMITAQRGFQANTRIITTSDEILQELVNLKR